MIELSLFRPFHVFEFEGFNYLKKYRAVGVLGFFVSDASVSSGNILAFDYSKFKFTQTAYTFCNFTWHCTDFNGLGVNGNKGHLEFVFQFLMNLMMYF